MYLLLNAVIVPTLCITSIFGRMTEAYIDPNTGGMLFQLLAVLFTLFSGIILVFSRQVKILLSRLKRFLSELSRGKR
jgi:hypothetical protein